MKHEISGTTAGITFALTCACTYIDYIENKFLKNEQPWISFRYIDDIFFIWKASKRELNDFWERLNNFHPDSKFTHERSRVKISSLDVTFRINQGEF